MKKVFSILMVAFMAASMVGCTEKDNGGSNGGNNGGNNNGGTPGANIAANTVSYNGHSYTLDEVVVDYYHSELTLVSAFTSDTLESGEPRLSVQGIHITPNAWNKTLNLADASQWPSEVLVALHVSGADSIAFEAWANDGVLGGGGTLDGVRYENETIFTSGTYSVTGNNDGTPITIVYDGMLKNGKTFKMKIVTGEYPTSWD